MRRGLGGEMSAAHAADHLVEKTWFVMADGMDRFGRLLLCAIDDGNVMDESISCSEIIGENHEFADHLVGWRLLVDMFDGYLFASHADFHLRPVEGDGAVLFAILTELPRDAI